MKKNHIEYKTNPTLNAEQIIEVFKSSGIKRPIDDKERIETMFKNSNLVIAAYCRDEVVGIARSVTDFSYCCYMSDLAVKKEFQKNGIGKKLIQLTKDAVSERSMLLLLSAPDAMEYYPNVGFERVENGFIIKRKS